MLQNKLNKETTRRRLLKLMGLGLAMPYCLSFINKSASDSISITGNLSDIQSLDHDGISRTYRIYVPDPLPEKPCAAVLLLHGHGGSVDQIMGITRGRQAPYRLWMPIADREGLILIIPDGLVSPDGKQGWNDARNIPTNPDSDDVGFLSTLIDTVAESYPIDFNRVYATGTSNGGHMVLSLAAELSEKFAAVAAVVASNPDPIFAQQPQHSISVMLMNGTNDRFIPYAGGWVISDRGKVQSTDDSIQYWVNHNNCEEELPEIQYADRSTADNCTASRTTYRNNTTNVEVSVVRILGGGHTEPSIKQPYGRLWLAVVGKQNRDIEMADEVWTFFQDKSVSPEPIQ